MFSILRVLSSLLFLSMAIPIMLFSQLLVDDFNDNTQYNSSHVNDLGKGTDDDGTMTLDSVSGGILTLNWNTVGDYWYSTVGTVNTWPSSLSGSNLSMYDFLAIRISGAAGNENPSIQLTSLPTTPAAFADRVSKTLPLSDFFPNAPSTVTQDIYISFDSYKDTLDFTKFWGLTLLASSGSGTIYIDNIEFGNFSTNISITTNKNIPNNALHLGSQTNTVFSFKIDTRNSADLTSLKFFNGGTADTNDISAVKLWVDEDSSYAYSSGDTYIGTFSNVSGMYELSGILLARDLTAGLNFVITVDVRTNAVLERTFRVVVPIGGVTTTLGAVTEPSSGCENIALQQINYTESLLLDDFDGSPAYGANDMGRGTDDDGTMVSDTVAGGILSLTWDGIGDYWFSTVGTINTWSTSLSGYDLSMYDFLVIRISGAVGNENPSLQLTSLPTTPAAFADRVSKTLPLSDFFPNAPSTVTQDIYISFDSYKDTLDFTKFWGLTLLATSGSGTINIDSLKFGTWSENILIKTNKNIPISSISLGGQNNTVLSFKMRTLASANLSSLKLFNTGTVTTNDITSIKLWVDENASYSYDSGDTFVGTFSNANGYFSLGNIALGRDLLSGLDLIVTIDVKNEAVVGKTFRAMIPVGGVTTTLGLATEPSAGCANKSFQQVGDNILFMEDFEDGIGSYFIEYYETGLPVKSTNVIITSNENHTLNGSKSLEFPYRMGNGVSDVAIMYWEIPSDYITAIAEGYDIFSFWVKSDFPANFKFEVKDSNVPANKGTLTFQANTGWQKITIKFKDLAKLGLDLSKISTMIIYALDKGTTGSLYLDDFELLKKIEVEVFESTGKNRLFSALTIPSRKIKSLSETFSLSVKIEKTSTVTIAIYRTDGSIVYKMVNGSYHSGDTISSSIPLEQIEKMKNGVYVLHLEVDDGSHKDKLNKSILLSR